MAYGTFKSVAEVAEKFDIEVSKKHFINEKELMISEYAYSATEAALKDEMNYVSEYAICEGVIRPMLNIVAKDSPFKIWSHVPYNVDKEKGLIGEPDYLVAIKNKYGAMEVPVLCIVEAKKDNFEEGWTQALAEMVASSLLGAKTCYGIVTTGAIWQFGKLEQHVFVRDPIFLSASSELQRVFNTINWVFDEIS